MSTDDRTNSSAPTGRVTNAMDRRGFLAASLSGGLATAGVLASGRLATAQPSAPVELTRPAVTPRRRVRMALKYGMIGAGSTIAEKLTIARDAGFDGVEFPAPSDLDTEEILRARDDSGMVIIGVVNSVHWSKPLSDPDPGVRTEGRHALERAMLTCRDLGGTHVLLVPAVVNGTVSYRDAWERSLSEIRRVLPLGRDLGVAIAIENVWNRFLLSPLEARRYLEELQGEGDNIRLIRGPDARGRRPVGWYFDVGNIWNDGWPSHWLETLGRDNIARLDIKGYSRAKADQEGRWAGFGVGIGDGDVPWGSVREWIKQNNWSGWATAEVGGGDADRLRDIADRMKRVLIDDD